MKGSGDISIIIANLFRRTPIGVAVSQANYHSKSYNKITTIPQIFSLGKGRRAKLILDVQLDMTEEAAASAAAKQLGYRALNLQLEIIKGIATARDVFAVLPTGYSKSLCYGCLPLV